MYDLKSAVALFKYFLRSIQTRFNTKNTTILKTFVFSYKIL